MKIIEIVLRVGIVIYIVAVIAKYINNKTLNIYFSYDFLVILLFLLSPFLITLWRKSRRSINKEGFELFNVLNKNNLEEFKDYLNKNYKNNVKALESVCYYGKMNILIYSISKNYYEIAKYLLDNGFNVNLHNDFVDSPVVYATHHGSINMLKLLLNYNPDLNIQSLKVC